MILSHCEFVACKLPGVGHFTFYVLDGGVPLVDETSLTKDFKINGKKDYF